MALVSDLDAMPLPSRTSCVIVSEDLGYFLHMTENGTVTAVDERSSHFFPYYRENTVTFEVQARPGSFLMVSHNTNSSCENTQALYEITSGIPKDNGYAEWTLIIGARGSYLSRKGECYAAFYENRAVCERELNDNSWVEMICQ